MAAFIPNGPNGFVTVRNLRASRSEVPRGPGIYCVLLPEDLQIRFLAQSTGAG
jgi:hypothetical protein